MYLQRDVTAHWLPSRGIFPSLQAWARQTWKEREINQCSETLAQPTDTCSSSLKDQFVFQSSDNSSFPHCGFSQMWYKPPASPSLLHHLWHQPKFKTKGEIRSFSCSSTVPWVMTEGQHCLTASGHGWQKHPRLTDSFFMSPRALGFSWRKFFLVKSFAVRRMLCGKKLKFSFSVWSAAAAKRLN